MGFFEMVGVASVVPFISILADPTIVDSNPLLNSAYRYSGLESADNFLFLAGLCVLVLLVGSIGFRAFTNYVIVRFTSMRSFSLGSRLVSCYLRQPYDWFLNRNSSDLGKTILTEVDQVIRGALLPLANFIAGIVSTLFILSLLVWTDPILAISVATVLITAYVLIYYLLRPKLRRVGQERVKSNRLKYQIVSEAFGGIKEIKLAGLEETFFRRYQGPARDFARAEAMNNLASSMPRFLLESIAFGGMLAIALYLMKTSGNLATALPSLALYAIAGYRLIPVMQQVYQSAVSLRYSSAAVDNLYHDFFENLPRPKKLNASDKHIELNEKIELRNVSFKYPLASQVALSDVNLLIPASSKVAFVGQTGSGKTTTVDIILGLLHPTDGQLLVDGELVAETNVRSWQRLIGYVPQQIYLADDTIASNIAFGVEKNEIDCNAVVESAKIANLHHFIVNEISDGYETLIGERGVRLSGGQRQRIGIARALYHKPRVLVLDEATSALDNLTEELVIEAIGKLNKEMTIVFIAHRLSTVKACDTIFLLDKGRLVASGSYKELFDNNLQFRTLATTITER